MNMASTIRIDTPNWVRVNSLFFITCFAVWCDFWFSFMRELADPFALRTILPGIFDYDGYRGQKIHDNESATFERGQRLASGGGKRCPFASKTP